MRTTAELREGFLSFFEARGHLRFPSWSLIPPPEDPSTLFVSAGMQPLKPYFSGAKQPPAPRFTTVQKCLRAGGKDTDLDQVGQTARHASMFEMLGNFSFGDYFKDGAIDLAWEFVTGEMGLDPDRLWATVFAGDPVLDLGEDDVAVRGWLRKGLPRDRIVPFPRSDNFWGPAGETGPCGPCSELHLDRGERYGCGRDTCGPNCEHCDRFIEFWNLVFMEYDLAADGSLTPLPKQNIDTGMGLERGAMLLQEVDSIFDTDGFRLIMDWIEHESGVGYGTSPEATKAHRVLSDHGRGITFLIAEGITPANEGRGYVLRRLIRRSVVQARRIGLPAVYPLPAIVVEQVGPWYPEVVEHASSIERIVRAEEERFRETLDRGMKEFEALGGAGDISADDAFRLAATYGFPVELTVELAAERGRQVDVEGYRIAMARHREISRGSGEKGAVQRAADFARCAGFTTAFVGYAKTDVLTQIGALEDLGDGTFLAKLRESPFYPAGGGQVTDHGTIALDGDPSLQAELVEAFRFDGDQALLFRGAGFAAGDRVRALVPWSIRFPTMANHTATHLLQEALREVLGEHVKQAGSSVRPDRLRFDFTHAVALTPEEREQVELRVNRAIFENRPLHVFETPIEEARKLGAMMLFGEKYGDIVRVVEIEGVSRELCGGTHVRTTAEIGAFTITSEGSVGAGARRIEAVTSGEAFALLRARSRELDEVRAELERLRKELKRKQAAPRAAGPVEIEAAVRTARGVNLIVQAVDGLDGDALLDLSDRFKQRHAPAAVVLGGVDDGKVTLIANFDPTVAEKVSASDVVRAAAAHVGGGGGGRPTMARAGGKDPAKLPDALAEAERLILAAL
ncbi:alaS: alanine--tRNA ligase [Gaiella occulta]|uniref:Alanine--tRNA ligase n=1 Tax=Gaiella occulta TaxID=1002870 RepID=A0A7M2YYU2_9ACTN|nr:alanine--tRNA ligase [Gaiella occulta]RDI75048.1 alaS: alanine--tRNA ligase [Gaiella occulta]